MNRGQLGRRYDFKFVTCGSESLRKSIGGTRNRSKVLELFLSKKNKSSIVKANRAIDKGVSTYCSGSISIVAHYEKISFNDCQVLRRWWRKQKKKLENRLMIELVKYKQCQEELQQCDTEAGISANDSSFASINDDDVYYDIVRGKNGKGNIYGLGRLSNEFICSTCLQPNLIEMRMVEQLEEMHEMIHILNNEFIAKEAKEKSLEEKVLKLLTPDPTPPNNNEDHIGNALDGYLDDALKDHILQAYFDFCY
ncbi:hypothetical protein CR513_22544, partial [Mucuna pruriens]